MGGSNIDGAIITPKKHVGLMLFVILEGVLYAILQKRGEFNSEKMGPESWIGGCQPTVHGKIEPGEDELGALKREIKEEVGKMVLDYFFDGPLPFGVLHEATISDEGCYFVGLVDPRLVNHISWGFSTGGPRLVNRKQAAKIVDLRSLPKGEVIDPKVTAMFVDDQKLLQFGIALFDPEGE